MEFSVKSGSPEKQRSACIVVGVFEPRRLSPIAEQLDKISDGYISALLRREFSLLVAAKNVSWMSVSTSRLFRKPLIR